MVMYGCELVFVWSFMVAYFLLFGRYFSKKCGFWSIWSFLWSIFCSEILVYLANI